VPEEFIILTQDADWSEPVEERHEYLTDILSAYTSAEQRVQLRTLPRFGLKFRLLLHTAEEAARFESDLWRLGARRVKVPLWPDATPLTAAAAPSETFLECETATRRFWAGHSAMLWRDPGTYEIVEVDSVTPEGLTLSAGLVGDWLADGRTYLVPILLGRLEDAPEMARITSKVGAIDINVISEGTSEDEGLADILQAAATGHLTMTHSSPLGNWYWSVLWSAFSAPSLPDDAVVEKIYAVMRATRHFGPAGPAQAWSFAGQNLDAWQLYPGGDTLGLPAYDEFDGVFFTEIFGSPDLTWLDAATIYARLGASLFGDRADDLMTAAVGLAVYYTSETPGDDSSDLDPPVEIPEGQGIAWSYPATVEARPGEPGATNGSAEGTAFVGPEAATFGTVYKDYDVIDLLPDESQDSNITYRRSVHHLDSQTGVDDAWDRAGVPIVGRKPLHLILEGRQEIGRILIFLARRRGALVPFWLPTWASDLQMSANLGAEDTELVVQDVGYSAGPFQSPARRFLAFVLRDGTQYYREVLNAEPGAPGTEVLTLDEGLPDGLSKDHTLVSYLVLCRLAADDPGLIWQTSQVAEVMLETVEVPAEVPAEVGS
jgi:hypothetical protein